MGFRVAILLTGVLLWVGTAGAAELEGVKLEDRITTAGQALQLNGIGLRMRVIFRVYVAGLYLPEKTQSADAALAAPGAKRVALVMMRDVGAEDFAEALLAGLQKNVAEAELAQLRPQVDELMGRMKRIGEAKKGMAIDLDYVPGEGTVLKVNGAARGAPIAGEAFFRALLSVWLGAKPVQDDLKKALLGQPG